MSTAAHQLLSNKPAGEWIIMDGTISLPRIIRIRRIAGERKWVVVLPLLLSPWYVCLKNKECVLQLHAIASPPASVSYLIARREVQFHLSPPKPDRSFPPPSLSPVHKYIWTWSVLFLVHSVIIIIIISLAVQPPAFSESRPRLYIICTKLRIHSSRSQDNNRGYWLRKETKQRLILCSIEPTKIIRLAQSENCLSSAYLADRWSLRNPSYARHSQRRRDQIRRGIGTQLSRV